MKKKKETQIIKLQNTPKLHMESLNNQLNDSIAQKQSRKPLETKYQKEPQNNKRKEKNQSKSKPIHIDSDDFRD